MARYFALSCSLDVLNASKLQDNAKYLAITNHIIACVYFFFNTDWLESLPEDVRTLVTDCVKEAVDYQESIDDDAQKDALEQMKKDGVRSPSLPIFRHGRMLVHRCWTSIAQRAMPGPSSLTCCSPLSKKPASAIPVF